MFDTKIRNGAEFYCVWQLIWLNVDDNTQDNTLPLSVWNKIINFITLMIAGGPLINTNLVNLFQLTWSCQFVLFTIVCNYYNYIFQPHFFIY